MCCVPALLYFLVKLLIYSDPENSASGVSKKNSHLHWVAASFCETQISKTEYIEICKLNNPAEGGGFNNP